jgi:hypothetical protein
MNQFHDIGNDPYPENVPLKKIAATSGTPIASPLQSARPGEP